MTDDFILLVLDKQDKIRIENLAEKKGLSLSSFCLNKILNSLDGADYVVSN